jgi:anthranilate 1,2-dioxygenase small subunit
MNSLIQLDGDRATARTSYLVILQAAGAGLVPSVAGTYMDALVRTPAGWRFRERRLVHDLRAELGLNVPDPQKP